jgi:AcrR family transcriptional regulator
VTDTETPAVGRRDRKKQQTRAALMAAALRLVDERGLETVTVEEISEAADVSTRTFFNYFAGKDDAVIGDPLTDPDELWAELLAQPAEMPMLDALVRAIEPSVRQIQAERTQWILRLRVIERNPALLPALLARGANAEVVYIAAIAERAGLPPDHPYPIVAASVTGAAFRAAMIRWARADGVRPLFDYVQEAIGIVADGLVAPSMGRN